jgi:hypothetical protein
MVGERELVVQDAQQRSKDLRFFKRSERARCRLHTCCCMDAAVPCPNLCVGASTIFFGTSLSSTMQRPLESHPANIVLDFGIHRNKRLSEVPNAYLGWLTMWKCAVTCCDDSDCEEDCGGEDKVRRFTASDCGAYCPLEFDSGVPF